MGDRGPIRDRTLVLRVLVPGLEARLRDKMEMEETAAAAKTGGNSNNASGSGGGGPSSIGTGGGNGKDLYLDLDGVTCEPTAAQNKTLWNFHCDGATYPAKLVNLPCPVELLKTHDHAAYYKCTDVAQMLIVYEDAIALQEAEEKPVEGFPSYYHSGLTPPLKRVVERRFEAREQKDVPPPRTAVSAVEVELMELMEKISKDEKSKRNKIPSLTTANKVLEEVTEEIVDYEPWMDDYGRQLHGVEFEAEDDLARQHPEVWISPDIIRGTKEEERAARAKKEAAEEKKKQKGKKKEKKKNKKEKESPKPKKGIASKKNTEIQDDITQAAASMLTSEDLLNDALNDGDDLFGDLGFDLNFDDDDLL